MQTLRKYIPRPIKSGLQKIYDSLLRKIYYFAIDTLELLLGRRDELIPPRSKAFLFGRGDYRKVGQVHLQYFIELCGLESDERVLDIGCGIGRMAVPLTDYLSHKGEYWGFDIVSQGIDWCNKSIAPRFPNFHFQLADVYNRTYNPNGRHQASEYKFPYRDGFFDFVFLTSVFTHMLPKGMENYLPEIARVLKPGGRCMVTFFLVDTESKRLIDAGLSTIDFKYEVGGCLTANKDRPEDAVAYDEAFVRKLYEQHKLRIIEPIHYGPWCGKESDLITIQDIVVAIKE